MKRAEEVMEILEAYDLTGSFRQAAALAGCEGFYVIHEGRSNVKRRFEFFH